MENHSLHSLRNKLSTGKGPELILRAPTFKSLLPWLSFSVNAYASVYMSFNITSGRAQQVLMQPTMEPASVKMQAKAAMIIIARKQLSMVLISLQLWTVVMK